MTTIRTRLLLGAVVFLLSTRPATALISKPTPLGTLLESATYVCAVKVDSFDPKRPSMVLSVQADLKGKLPERRIPMLLKGDSEAEKLKHTPQILKRLAKDLPLVLLIERAGDRYVGFAYTNGTWFQIVGEKDKDALRWAYTHGEPYLRRTFKGTTEEMTQIIKDALSGKKAPPKLDQKEKPGFGPEVKEKASRGREPPVGDRNRGLTPPARPDLDVESLAGLQVRVIALASGRLSAGPLSAAVSLAQGRLPRPRGAVLLGEAWRFEAAAPSDTASSPLVVDNRVYVGVIRGSVFARSGAVVCLDRSTGKQLWKFDDGGKMRPSVSMPCVADGRLYVGEGFHENLVCKLYCLDANTGKKLWAFETSSHTESSPTVVAGRVYFGAGDDGLYCLDAVTGKKRWQYPDPKDQKNGLHIDANPAVVEGCVYCGSGVSQTFRKLQVFCLDAVTGKQLWARDDIDLPAWGSPCVAGGQVYFGLGNGRLTRSDDNPKGAVLCLDTKDGKRRWQFDGVKDGVHARPTVDRHHVYVASRDGHCYCLDRRGGRLVWKRDLGSPSVSAPAVARCSCCGASNSLYVAATSGAVLCLDPDDGRVFWRFEDLTGFSASLLSSPTVEVERTKTGDRRRVYFASGVNAGTTAVAYCLKDQWVAGPRRADD